MTARSDFTDDEWRLLQEGPVTAGMIVIAASGGGTIRESFALARAYADARRQQGESELLNEITSAKPEIDRHQYGSSEELHERGLQRVGEAAALVRARATTEELTDYRAFVISVASRVAAAHKEEGQKVSPAEEAALAEVRARMEGEP
jgi:hypothetical protein